MDSVVVNFIFLVQSANLSDFYFPNLKNGVYNLGLVGGLNETINMKAIFQKYERSYTGIRYNSVNFASFLK